MKINGSDEITITDVDGECFSLEVIMCHPDGDNDVQLLLTRDELVELKTRIDMLLELTR